MKKIFKIFLISCLIVPLTIIAETPVHEHEHESIPVVNICESPRNICEFCECALKKPVSDQDRISYITQCKLDCNNDITA